MVFPTSRHPLNTKSPIPSHEAEKRWLVKIYTRQTGDNAGVDYKEIYDRKLHERHRSMKSALEKGYKDSDSETVRVRAV